MKTAIVGTSNLTDTEHELAVRIIEELIYVGRSQGHDIITGDAAGIDSIARELGATIVCKAKNKSWKGKDGFKERNIKIAQMADYIYCFSTQIKKEGCYHCDIPNHERTGGCWTLKFARDKLGKKGKLIVV